MVDTETPGERLKMLRGQLGLGVREASRRAEGAVTHSQISNIENNLTPWSGVKLGTLEGLARAYNMSLTKLLEVATGRTSEVKEMEGAQVGKRLIPVYNLVCAGNGADGGEIVDYIEISAEKKGERVAYQIHGDSMMPRIFPNAVVEVLVQNTARPGVIIVCYAPDSGMVCKLLSSITPDGYYVLTSYNEQYKPLVVNSDECHIKGVVTEIRNPAPNGEQGDVN